MRIWFVIFLFLVITGNVKSQDFEPGEQARGYLNGKNVTVDHATGIFHYKVPLYTLRSGEFQLPVSLDYAATGVKQSDAPGLVGYNWILNTGGIVTRTIRGGIADESAYSGYLWAERETGAISLAADVKKVNQRDRDGEIDIFTAVFNGESVRFIIKMDQNEKIYAEPLERTNVRIACESGPSGEINGWIVTDENGNRYIYRQKEWSSDMIQEGAISFNGVRDGSYVSSWYLNRVEPLNGEPIVFNYLADVREFGDQDNIHVSIHSSSTRSIYYYGKPLEERPFDFSKYQTSFSGAIARARNYLNGFSLEMQLNNNLIEFTRHCEWVRNPGFEAGMSNIYANYRIMGQLASFGEITNASGDLIQILDDLCDTYARQTSQNARMAASCFLEARNCVKNCILEVNRNVAQKEANGITSYFTRSPLLDNISCVDRVIRFNHEILWRSARLTSVKSCDIIRRQISEVRLTGSSLLMELSFLDKEGQETGCLKFDYYTRPSGKSSEWDKWGYLSYPNASCSNISSLKKITTIDRGEITIEYESNVVASRINADPENLAYSERYGGIRVKSLVLDDRSGAVADTIRYSYPVAGLIVYDKMLDWEEVHYRDFTDRITHLRAKFEGSAFLNTGNNGIYYRYVREAIRGKGTRAYLFHVPTRYPNSVSSLQTPYAFWLNGLPLGTATYDQNGNLKQIVKNKYYTDLAFGTNGYFESGGALLNYTKKIPQVKANEYFMDAEELSQYYQDQDNIFLFDDNYGTYYFNPYEEIYLANIEPRTTVILPPQYYEIFYGGKTLLKERQVYRFETPVTSGPSYSDFSTKTSGTPFQKEEYFYDNLQKSTRPTRVIMTDSRGDKHATVTKRVTEMENTVDPVIVKMKDANALTPVVKQLQLKNDLILNETISVFGMLNVGNACCFGLARQYIDAPATDVIYSPSATDGSLFTRGQSNYLEDQSFVYKQKKGSYLPVGVSSRSGSSAVCYDFLGNQTILNVEHAIAASVGAADMKKYKDAQAIVSQIVSNGRNYDMFERFYRAWQEVDDDVQSTEYLEYLSSMGYYLMTQLIQIVATRDQSIPYGETRVMLDSVWANHNFYIREFVTRYEEVIQNNPDFSFPEYDLHKLADLIMDPEVMTREFFECRDLANIGTIPSYGDPVKVTSLPVSKRMKVFALTNGTRGSVSYSVVHSGGTTRNSLPVASAVGYVLQVFDIDLTSYTGVVSVTVDPTNVPYVAFVPEQAVFEATSYSLDGTVFCKFDHTGQMELNEYDAAGRVTRVKDREGNVTREYQYNVANDGSPTVLSYTMTRNFVAERVFLAPTGSLSSARHVNNVTYLDGFGRTLQEVQVGASPGGTADLIVPHVYGVQGRVEREYLPYSKIGNNGVFDANAMAPGNWNVYGSSDAAYAFTSTAYDGSPLDRMVKQTGPGRAWHVAGKGVTTSYGMNVVGEVRLYRVGPGGTLTLDGTYAPGTLEKMTVVDEDGSQVETFTSNTGKTVLTVSVGGNDRLETFSVYDSKGLLRYVLSPEASLQLGTGVNETVLGRLAYRYDHDRWGRVVMKRLPGCDPVYMVYDRRDRLVMSQDGKQRVANGNRWSYSLYDESNRVMESGEVVLTTATTHAALQAAASASDYYVPVGTRVALQYTVYDNYLPTANVTARPFVATPGYSTTHPGSISGMVTSVKTKVLETGTWLTTTTYYDDRGRVIQAVSDNLHGYSSRVDVKHDFVGNMVQQRESHGVISGPTDVFETVNTFDDRGRPLTATTRLNNGTPAVITYTYDAVGRLVSKKHGTVTETLSYNPRGWLTSKESTPFKMKLRYEAPEGGMTARYNGNVSEWEWQQGTSPALMYGFTYDGVNRLTGSAGKQKSGTTWGAWAGSYLEQGITYDRNGNIKTLQRTAGGTTVDNLVYAYTGNRLTGLTENVRSAPTGDIFAPGSVASGTYSYDGNGNLVNDSRKVLNFTYNVLNLLNEVKTGSTVKAKYDYLADGTKLRVRDGGGVNGFDYLGSLTYKKSSAGLQLETANFGSGVIRMTGSNSGQTEVNYFLTDHLGSVRAVVDGSGVVREQNDYYPFGARHARADQSAGDNRLKYNGKEEQVTGDLEWLDYGARMYDAGLGRWYCMDLLAESYYSNGSYVYCLDSPVKHIDPDGTSTWAMNNGSGMYRVIGGNLNDYSKNIYVVNSVEDILYLFHTGKTSTILGETMTMTSFYDSDKNEWLGTINLMDKSGMKFMDDFISNIPSLINYMSGARNEGIYDFKHQGYDASVQKPLDHYYRGMPFYLNVVSGSPVYASARDIGNFAAGYIVGVNGLPWKIARVGFDAYQSSRSGKLTGEGVSTRNAQRAGYDFVTYRLYLLKNNK